MSKDKAAEKCCAGCKMYYGGEIRHHKDCVFYPESLTSIYDKMDAENVQLREALRELVYFKSVKDSLPPKNSLRISNKSVDVFGSRNNGTSYYPFTVYYDFDKERWFSSVNDNEVKVCYWRNIEIFQAKQLLTDNTQEDEKD